MDCPGEEGQQRIVGEMGGEEATLPPHVDHRGAVPVVGSVGLVGRRRLRFTHMQTREQFTVPLEPGDVLIFQDSAPWLHEVLPEPGVSERIVYTVRGVIAPLMELRRRKQYIRAQGGGGGDGGG